MTVSAPSLGLFGGDSGILCVLAFVFSGSVVVHQSAYLARVQMREFPVREPSRAIWFIVSATIAG
jgi:hypothetical protein